MIEFSSVFQLSNLKNFSETENQNRPLKKFEAGKSGEGGYIKRIDLLKLSLKLIT